MSTPTLEIDRLTVDLPVRGKPLRLIHDVSLEIGSGETLGVVGESGSGKSLTARAVMRMLMRGADVGGRIRFCGEDVYEMSSARLREYRSHGVAMIYQSPHAYINPMRTVGDFLTEALVRVRGHSRAEAEKKVVELLASVGIPDGERRLRQYPHQLSGGLLQRVMIAAALAVEPQLLLADEPTTALDVTSQQDVMAILAEAKEARQLSMLLITHDIDLAAAVCDRIAVMYAGRILETGAAAELVANPQHPYTAGLLAARPTLTTEGRLQPIPSELAAALGAGAHLPAEEPAEEPAEDKEARS
ncbi:ABC transporter ATP-binding protein [Nocardioides sp.]|uniref:ABC transporter ATP-binding protein n=1 Tax=Nocardioides sp. TaxID=35761 RepID=UPI0039E6D322